MTMIWPGVLWAISLAFAVEVEVVVKIDDQEHIFAYDDERSLSTEVSAWCTEHLPDQSDVCTAGLTDRAERHVRKARHAAAGTQPLAGHHGITPAFLAASARIFVPNFGTEQMAPLLHARLRQDTRAAALKPLSAHLRPGADQPPSISRRAMPTRRAKRGEGVAARHGFVGYAGLRSCQIEALCHHGVKPGVHPLQPMDMSVDHVDGTQLSLADRVGELAGRPL